MGFISNIKRNLLIRGFVSTYQRYIIRRSQFGYMAPSARITPPCSLSGAKNISFEEGCVIDGNSLLYATNAKIVFKKYVVSAKGLHIVTGDHERRVGRFCATITEAEKDHNKNLDRDVVVEDDVWFGLNVTVMPGVIVGRGSTIGAESVVTKSIPPYCIAVGSPAKPIKFYWTIDQIMEHEAKLYPESKRFTREELEAHRDCLK